MTATNSDIKIAKKCRHKTKAQNSFTVTTVIASMTEVSAASIFLNYKQNI